MENIEEMGAQCTRVIEAFIGPHADVVFIAIGIVALVTFCIAVKKCF